MTQSRHIRIVSLWIHPGQDGAFEAFEREAARIMARHGGRIDSAVRIRPGGAGDRPFEVHVVSFPDRRSGQILRRRSRNGGFAAPGRAEIIARTVVLEGRDGWPVLMREGPEYLAFATGLQKSHPCVSSPQTSA